MSIKATIVSFLKRQCKRASAKGLIVGLSGGIDSAVVAALAKEAVGKNRVLALTLPCFSQKEDLEDAKLVARKLNINTNTIDLSGIYSSFIKILPQASKMAKSNLKPRLRMIVLYYFANKLNYLVCGTGNKSEIMAGYFTKYGDGASDVLPLGGLLKKQVKALAKELKIPERIINKPPTAGLWPGQTDESEMGITYSELDDILERITSKRKQVMGRDKVDRVKAMIKKSEHKRQGSKICCV